MKKLKYIFVLILMLNLSVGISYGYDQYNYSNSYKNGDKVSNKGNNYECLVGGWCGQEAYEPGGKNPQWWPSAWKKLSNNSSGVSPKIIPKTIPKTPIIPKPTLTNNTQIKPGTPNIAWMQNKISQKNYQINWNMWWGENGDFVKLEENGKIIATKTIEKKSPNAQKGTFELKNKLEGIYNYNIYLCNKFSSGEICTKSAKKTLEVNFKTTTNPTFTPTKTTTTNTTNTKKTTTTQNVDENIKRIIASARALPGTPKIDLNNTENNPENVKRAMKFLTKEKWNKIFPARKPIYKYEELLKAIAKFPALCGEKGDYTNLNLDEVCKKELATIFAHATQETGGHSPSSWLPDNPGLKVSEWQQGLYYVSELGCENGGCEYRGGTCESNTWQGKTWPCPAGAKYYGRGAKQLSYNYNYGQFSKVMFGDVNVLLKNPDKVAQEGWLAISSAIWFYMTPQSPKPSMHDVVAGFWQANENDKKSGITAGFGATINIINGGIECGPSQNEIAQAKNRINYYKEFAGEFGLQIPSGEVLGCKDQARFSSGGSGSIPTYWERDWAQDGKCKAVRYQTPHSIFDKNSYAECVKYHFGINIQATKTTTKTSTKPKTTSKNIIPENKIIENKIDKKTEIKDSPKTLSEIKNEKIAETIKKNEKIYEEKITKFFKKKMFSQDKISKILIKIEQKINNLNIKKIGGKITETEYKVLLLLKIIKNSLYNL